METFTRIKALVENPRFADQRQASLERLDFSDLDAPMVPIMRAFARLPHCFTLQCCYGHFLYGDRRDDHQTAMLPVEGDIGSVDYRLAYVAMCIQNNKTGKAWFDALGLLPAIAPDYVQFGCATWFWQRQVNSYALQIAPRRHMFKDRMLLDCDEARHVERIRNRFYAQLKVLLQTQLKSLSA